jgi:D-beta-D-heptose 7-phosphate kinase/D-beta-D-heptose 1-phosphate adenosyltransferase
MEKPIILLGDCILDKYIIGDVSRISPEAPVPILAVENEKLLLGGAGNVANNLQALEANFDLVYVAGKCPDSLLLGDLLEDKGVNAKCYQSASNRTVVKTRIISGIHQIVRLDYDNSLEPKTPNLMFSDIKSTL